MNQKQIKAFIDEFTGHEHEEELDRWDLYEYADEVMVDEITAQHRWETEKRYVLRFGERFLEINYVVGSTELQDGYDYGYDVREVFPKEVTTIIYD